MLDAMAVLHLEGAGEVEVEIYGPNPTWGPYEQRSWLRLIIPVAGLCGAAFIYGLECLSTASSWGYPVNIGGRPEFSWPDYIPIAVSWGLFCAALGGFFGFCLLGGMFRYWRPAAEANAIRGAMRDQWVLAVQSEDEDVIARIRPLLFSLSPRPVDTIPPAVEEIPA